MKAVTIQSENIKELEMKIEETITSDYQPSLAFVFASVTHDLQKVSEIFKNRDIVIFGSGSSSEIIQDEVLEHSIVVMLLNLKREHFAIYYEETQNANTAEISRRAATFAKEKFLNPAMLVLTSSLTTDGVSVIDGVSEVIKTNIPLFGGMASDFTMGITTIFTNNKIIEDGVIFLILNNDKIKVNGIATSGWEAVGVEKTVTKAIGNVIYSIDHKPALDMFLKYYNLENSKEPLGLSVGTKYPLQVSYKNKPSVLRTPIMGNEEDRSIMLTGRIEQGAKVKFSIQPTFDIIEKTIEDIKILHDSIPETDAMIIFSCAGRKVAFGPLMEDEVSGIHEIWDAPLIGFFTYGEIGSFKNEAANFHNETCLLMLLKEV